MAELELTYSKELDSDHLLNAFNSNITRFRIGDGISFFGDQKLTARFNDEFEIDLYPNAQQFYELDLKTAAVALINKNAFKNEIEPDIITQIALNDSSILLELSIELSCFVDQVKYEKEINFKMIKAVSQIGEYVPFDIGEDKVKIYTQRNSLDTHFITFWEGYPFDFSVFSDSDQNATIENISTQSSYNFTVKQGISRIFLSDGENNLTLLNRLNLFTGLNVIDLTIGNITKRIMLTYKESSCAPYFRYYRNDGTFAYMRFEPSKNISFKTTSGKEVYYDFNGIGHDTTKSLPATKTSAKAFDLYTELLDSYQADSFKDFIRSPRVEMYIGNIFDTYNEDDFISVRVTSSSVNTRDFKAKKIREKVQVELQEYNLSL